MNDLLTPSVQPQQSNDLFKNASDWINEVFKPVSQPLGQIGAKIGKPFGPVWEQAGKHAGESLPRLAVDVALSTRGGKLPKAVGLGDVALQSLGQTADQGLNPVQRAVPAALQVGAFAAAPAVAHKFGQVAGQAAKPVAEVARRIGGANTGALVQSGVEKGASLTGMLGTLEAASAVSAPIMGQPLDEFVKERFSPENIATSIATILPFEALGLPATLKRFGDIRSSMKANREQWFEKMVANGTVDKEKQSYLLTAERDTVPVELFPRQAKAMENEGLKRYKVSYELQGFGLKSEFVFASTPTEAAEKLKQSFGVKPINITNVMSPERFEQLSKQQSQNDYEAELLQYEKDLKDWQKQKNKMEAAGKSFDVSPPDKPDLTKREPKAMAQQKTEIPPWFREKEKELRGPFELSGPRVVLSEFGEKFNPTDMLNRLKNTLHPDEMKFYEDAGIGEVVASGKSRDEVARWMQESGPRVQSVTYGMEGKVSEDRKAFDRMTHEWRDNLSTQVSHDVIKFITSMDDTQSRSLLDKFAKEQDAKFMVNLRQYADLAHKTQKEIMAPSPRATSAYDSVSAFPTTEPMPEWTKSKEGKNVQRVDVVMPLKKLTEADRAELVKKRDLTAAKYHETEDPLWQPDNLHENLPNTLGWVMIQYRTGAKGEKIAVIVEAQSRWGQTVRKDKQELEAMIKQRSNNTYAKEALANIQDHPLLRDYNRLILKAAIDQAKKEGAEKIVVSDAETAMMTEKHDVYPSFGIRPTKENIIIARKWADKSPQARKVLETLEANKIFELDKPDYAANLTKESTTTKAVEAEQAGFKVERIPEQEPGMRLNYDTILPRIAEELTGAKGERVELGEHKNAFEEGRSQEQRITGEGFSKRPRQNLIFRNPDGTPKTTTSGLAFDITKIGDKPFDLFAKDKLSTRLARPSLSEKERFELEQLDKMDWVETPEIAERMSQSDRMKTESLIQFQMRKLGIDPKLESRNDPQSLLRDSKMMIESYTKEVLGLSDAESEYWSEKYLHFVARLGSSQGETRVVPALPYTAAEKLFATSFYAPPRADVPNAFIGLFQPTEQSTGRIMAEFFHTTAHELFHGALEQARLQQRGEVGYTEKMPPRMVKAANNLIQFVNESNLTKAEMQESVRTTLNMLAGGAGKFLKEDLMEQRFKFYEETPAGREEYLADMFGLIAMGATAPRKINAFKTVEDLLRFGNDDLREFARGMFKNVGALWNYMQQALKEFFGWKPQSIKSVTEVVENMQKLIASTDKADKAIEALLRVQTTRDARPWAPVSGLSYNRVEQLFRAIGAEPVDKDVAEFRRLASPMIVPQTDKQLPNVVGPGKRLSWIDYFKALPQLVRSVPEFADMGFLGRNYGVMSDEAATAMWSYLNVPGTNKLDLDKFSQLRKSGTKLNTLANKVALLNNSLSGPEEGQFISRKTIHEMEEYKTLSEADRVYFDDIFNADRIGATHIEAAIKNVDSIKHDIAFRLGHVLMAADRTMSWQEAQRVGRAITVTNVDVDRLQTVAGRAADERLVAEYGEAQKIVAEFGARKPDILQKAQEVFALDEKGMPVDRTKKASGVRSVVDKFNEVRGKFLGEWLPPDAKNANWHFRGKPGFMSEVRLGKWYIVAKKKNEEQPSLFGFTDKASFDARMKKLGEDPDYEWVQGKNKEDQEDLFKGLRPDAYQAYADVISAINNRVIATIEKYHPEASEALAELREEIKPTASTALAALLESPYMKKRRLLGGREELNMVEGMVHYVSSVAHTVGKRYARGQQSLFLNDPKMRNNPQLKKTAAKYFNEIVDPTERGLENIKAMVAMNYVFFSPSLAVIELTQQLNNFVPGLISQGTGVGQAYKMLINANKDMAAAFLRGRKQGLKFNVYENKDEQAAIEHFVRTNVIDKGWLQEVYHTKDDLPFINQRNLLTGDGSVLNRDGLIGKPLYHLYRIGRDFHGLAISMNNEVAALASYRMYRSKGLTHEKALRETDDLVRETMHGGGRASRPLWFLGVPKVSPGSTVGGLMYTLQTYVYNTVAQMSRYGYNAMLNSNLSSSEKVQFAKAFSTMMGMQLFLAGTMGIPVTAQMFALVEQAFPNTEPKRRAREMFFGVGKWINDKTHIFQQDEEMGHFMSTAGMDGLASAISPWNLSNRFELGVLMGVDPYRGFDWKNVVGPGGALLEQILFKPAQKLAEGQPLDAAIAALPNSNVRRMAQLATDGFNVRNKDDQLGLELRGGEATSLALGFTPKRVAEYRELNDMKIRAESVTALEQKKFHHQMATMLQQGLVQEVKSALQQRSIETGGEYDSRAGARQIAEIVQGRTAPVDPLASGSRASRSYKLGEMFPETRGGGMSEQQRLYGRAGIEQMLGGSGQVTRTERTSASLIDQMMTMNPSMSRSEAKALLDAQARKRLF